MIHLNSVYTGFISLGIVLGSWPREKNGQGSWLERTEILTRDRDVEHLANKYMRLKKNIKTKQCGKVNLLQVILSGISKKPSKKH